MGHEPLWVGFGDLPRFWASDVTKDDDHHSCISFEQEYDNQHEVSIFDALKIQTRLILWLRNDTNNHRKMARQVRTALVTMRRIQKLIRLEMDALDVALDFYESRSDTGDNGDAIRAC